MNAPIAYTYEADTHCEACTVARFGGTTGTDAEGNSVGAIFSWDEWCEPSESGVHYLTCGTCLGIIEEHEHERASFTPEWLRRSQAGEQRLFGIEGSSGRSV